MKNNDARTNELLAQVVERFRLHSKKVHSDDQYVAWIASQNCKL